MIPADELAELRAAVLDLLPDTCVLQNPTAWNDNGVPTTWGTVGTVACRMDFYNGTEGVAGAAVIPFIGYMLTLPYSAAVQSNYRVTHGGYTYAVVGGANDDQSDAIVRRVKVARL